MTFGNEVSIVLAVTRRQATPAIILQVNSKGVQNKGEDVSLLDSSLTSLSWLQNLRVHDLISPAALSPDQCSVEVSPERGNRKTGFSLSPVKKCLLQSADFKKHPKKYCKNPTKPPFSHSTLIYLAIQHSKSGKVTLNQLYRWIKDNFKFYRNSEPSWQNSIRHSLSLSRLFCKIPRAHTRGNYWTINNDYCELLGDGKARVSSGSGSYGRKRAHSHSEGMQSKSIRKKRRESENTTSPSDLSGDLDWVSLLGVNGQHHKPGFTSPDMPHPLAGEPVLCSPLTLPTTITATVPVELPSTPQVSQTHGSLLEEVVLKQDSQSPQVVLPWAEGNSQSPVCSAQTHPWAESKESTMHELHNLIKLKKCLATGQERSVWSPDHSWSSSNLSSYSSTSMAYRTSLLKGTSTC